MGSASTNADRFSNHFAIRARNATKREIGKRAIFFSVNIISNTNLSFRLYYKGISYCVARMSTVMYPAVLQLRGKF